MAKKESLTDIVVRRMTQTILGSIAAALFTLISVSCIGAYYPEAPHMMHLDWLYVPLRGIYADCSLPENRGAGFCKVREDRAYDMHRASIREHDHPPPFTLYKSPY